MDQIQPATNFRMAQKLSMVFTFSKMVGKYQRIAGHDLKSIWTSNFCVSKWNYIRTQLSQSACLFSIAAFIESWTILTEAPQPTKPKIVTLWPFRKKKIANPCFWPMVFKSFDYTYLSAQKMEVTYTWGVYLHIKLYVSVSIYFLIRSKNAFIIACIVFTKCSVRKHAPKFLNSILQRAIKVFCIFKKP